MNVLQKENPPLGNTGSLYVLLRVWEKGSQTPLGGCGGLSPTT